MNAREALAHQLTYVQECLRNDEAYDAHPTQRDEAGLALSGCSYEVALDIMGPIAAAIDDNKLDQDYWLSELSDYFDSSGSSPSSDDAESIAPQLRDLIL